MMIAYSLRHLALKNVETRLEEMERPKMDNCQGPRCASQHDYSTVATVTNDHSRLARLTKRHIDGLNEAYGEQNLKRSQQTRRILFWWNR